MQMNLKGRAEKAVYRQPAYGVIKTGCRGLQQCFDPLLQAGTLRLKLNYWITGLIVDQRSLMLSCRTPNGTGDIIG
jgi:hypothetical protein